MPILAIIALSVALIGAVWMVAHQIKTTRRDRANMRAFERGEDFKGVSDWD